MKINNSYKNKVRKIMNSNELKIDNMWYEIMSAYIPDEDLTIEIEQTYDLTLVMLAISYVENYRNNLSLYYGINHYQAFKNSGFLDSLLVQDREYLEMMFDEEYIELIDYER